MKKKIFSEAESLQELILHGEVKELQLRLGKPFANQYIQIYVPQEYVDYYKLMLSWSEFADNIQAIEED